MRILSSHLRPPPAPQRAERVPFPRYRNGRVVVDYLAPEQFPPGWQSVGFHVPHRPATCEETHCPMFLNGWTEVVTADGGRNPKVGRVTRDEAAAEFGLFGPHEIAPATIEHPPGTPCPRFHAVPDGRPPLYRVDGRIVGWTEFEDALGGGVHHMGKLLGHG